MNDEFYYVGIAFGIVISMLWDIRNKLNVLINNDRPEPPKEGTE